MLESTARAPLNALTVSMLGLLAALAAAGPPASAQPLGRPPVPPWLQPQQPPSAPPQQTTAPPPASPVIARVEGRAITQEDFDRVAQPYFRQLQAQFGNALEGNLLKTANFNVLDELIRRELLAVEAQRQKIEVTPAEVDSMLSRDSFFLTNGKFDAAKFASYKASPGSNYLQVLPRFRETVALNKLDASLRRRFKPTPSQVRAEWTQRTDQVRFQVLPLLARDFSPEPEASEAEWERYYQAHRDEFLRKTRVRLRYVRLPLPPERDSTRAAEEAKALERARAVADSLRQGTMPDTSAQLTDTGLFELPAQTVPRLGRVPALTDTLARADEDSTLRIVGPVTALDAVIVGVVAERQPRHVPPMREVLGDVKRRADAEKRRQADDEAKLAFYAAHPERWRTTRCALTRMTFRDVGLAVERPSRSEVERWYAQHGRSLFGMSDTSRAWVPTLNDSLRGLATSRMMQERRLARVTETAEKIVAGWRSGRDARSVARAQGAVAETLFLTRAHGPDSLFSPLFMDSLVAGTAGEPGVVQGPRAFGGHVVLWRVDARDTAYVPPYEAARAQADQAYADDRRQQDEAEARTYYEQHRDEFKTPMRYGLDYVVVRIPPPDSVRVPEAEVRKAYDADPQSYRQEEQVRAKHILFSTREGGPDVDARAKARADSLLDAIRENGGDFGELARQFSQDPSAAANGGDLGWFGRGRMVREFEEAAFALKPGEIGPVVKTAFGYHIVKVEERRPEGMKPFEEVRDQIRRALSQSQGDSTARRSALSLRRRLAAGGDAKSLAAPHGGLVAGKPVGTNESLPGLGFPSGLARDLPLVTTGRWLSNAYRSGNGYVVFRLREKVAPHPAEFDEAKAQAVEAMKAAKRREVLDRKVEGLRAALAAGASLDSLAAPYGGLKDSGFLPRSAGFVPMLGSEPRVVERAFATTAGQVSDTIQVAAGVAWVRVEERKTGEADAFKATAPQLENDLAQRRYNEWLEARKKTVKIEILRPDLQGPRPSPFGA